MKRFFLFLLLTAKVAQGATMSDLPSFSEVSYKPSPRDPFIDSSVSRTLLTSVEDRDATKAAPPIETYEKELRELFASSEKVYGIAVAGDQGFAIVNGRMVETGERLYVALPDSLCERLLSTSQFYGLGLNTEIEGKYLSATVERVSPEGIQLKVRGMRTTLLLEYHPQNEVEIINP